MLVFIITQIIFSVHNDFRFWVFSYPFKLYVILFWSVMKQISKSKPTLKCRHLPDAALRRRASLWFDTYSSSLSLSFSPLLLLCLLKDFSFISADREQDVWGSSWAAAVIFKSVWGATKCIPILPLKGKLMFAVKEKKKIPDCPNFTKVIVLFWFKVYYCSFLVTCGSGLETLPWRPFFLIFFPHSLFYCWTMNTDLY